MWLSQDPAVIHVGEALMRDCRAPQQSFGLIFAPKS